MLTAIMALLTALLAALPVILTMIETAKAKKSEEAHALERRSVDELTAGADRLRQPPV